MRFAGIQTPFRFLMKPEVWVITLDVVGRAEGFREGVAIKAYTSKHEALREKRRAEALILGCIAFLIQNSNRSSRHQLLEREPVWIELCEMLPKGFGPDGFIGVYNQDKPILEVVKLRVK